MAGQAPPDGWSGFYRERRNRVRAVAKDGVILWLGHAMQPRNYAGNAYPFRQNSHFLYYTGLADPDLALLSYPEKDCDILFLRPEDMDDVVWSGAGRARADMARDAGVETIEDIGHLGSLVSKARSQGLKVHYLPPYQASSLLKIAELLGVEPAEVPGGASVPLMEAVARQRSIKSDAEAAEIEDALVVTDRMHRAAMAAARPGMREYEIAGLIQGIALSAGRQLAFTPIVTVRGEVLHNHSYDNVLSEGRLVLNDSGAESRRFYAGDITRTFPVSGRFTSLQAEVYETVLRAQLTAIEMTRPGVTYDDVHTRASEVLAEGLTSIGVMKGHPADAVAAGAHALFFPHGIGHMLGLDVHDMEDLGDIVGYGKDKERSRQFGRNFLRLAKCLEPGFLLTVEPGIYFIPALMDRWEQEQRHAEFICYDKLGPFRDFGGIRVEDNVYVTADGRRVLGPGIPKTIAEVEAACARGERDIASLCQKPAAAGGGRPPTPF
ncbi:MAG: aminopeptidase P N-terminal domain-containing protein [Acidobacteria bacterium]|nr:aminopeptidase P N-terminal domain-containing protein [Acidobacteriota bacterium]